MLHLRARSFRRMLLATVLVTVVAAPAEAAPAVPAPATASDTPTGAASAKKKGQFEVEYDIVVGSHTEFARALGEFTWTTHGLRNDGRLINQSDDGAYVRFIIHPLERGGRRLRLGKAFQETFRISGDQHSVHTDFYTLQEIGEIKIEICRIGEPRAGRSRRWCEDETHRSPVLRRR